MKQFEHIRLSVFISVFVIFTGFILGGIYGSYEDAIKEHFYKKALTVSESVYNNNQEIMKVVAEKSWEYMKHAHTHAVGLGPATLILILVLSFFKVNGTLKFMSSMLMSLGAVAYPLYWMLLAFKFPLTGNEELAKESLSCIAVPGAGIILIGVFLFMIIIIRNLFKKNS